VATSTNRPQSHVDHIADAHRQWAVAAPTDLHQHLWPEAFCAALSRRSQAPRLERAGTRWVLHAAGEPAYVIDPSAHDPVRRAEQARADGIARVVIVPSCPVGIESLPARESEPILEAYHAGVAELGDPFRAWAAAGLDAPDPMALSARLAAGFVGLCVPARAFASPDETWRLARLLDVLAARRAPLLIHPGPAPWAPQAAVPPHAPAWWVALTSYVAQMQQAWFVFHQFVRPEFPDLRVCFAMLAGLAPLQADRLRSRGTQPIGNDALTFLETSSYGPETVAAIAAVVGAPAVVFGSDHPIVDTAPMAADARFARDNVARLIFGEEWE